MKITDEERAIIGHVVVDPDAWVAHALKEVGEWAVQAKIDKYRDDYLDKKDKSDYKNRAERQAKEDVESQERIRAKENK